MLYGTADTQRQQQQQQMGDEEAEQQEYDNTYHHHVSDYSIPHAYTQTPPTQLVQPPHGASVINSTLVNSLLEIFQGEASIFLLFRSRFLPRYQRDQPCFAVEVLKEIKRSFVL